MDAVEVLLTRASAIKLTEPAPTAEALDKILAAAARAPDHGRLRPWRFIVIRGEARHKLGALMAERMRSAEPDGPAPLLEREAAKPLRAPMIVTVATQLQRDHPKIPEVEQLMSAVCAAQNIMLAAHALGYGCMWKTGKPAYDPMVKQALGLAPHEHVVGFLYLGTVELADPGKIKRPAADAFTDEWAGG